MKRNILVGLGVVVLLTLGFWGYQSELRSKPEGTNLPETPAKEPWQKAGDSSVQPSIPLAPALEKRPKTEWLPGSISGTVRLKTTGAPVAGVVLQVRKDVHVNQRDGKVLSHTFFESVLVTTDEKGSYTLTGIPPGMDLRLRYVEGPSPDLYVFDGNCPNAVIRPGETKTGVNLKLSQGTAGTIAGIVIGRKVDYRNLDDVTSETESSDEFIQDEDTPLPGITVTLSSDNGERKTTVVTDQAGNFRFENIRPDSYKVRPDFPQGAALFPDQALLLNYSYNIWTKPIWDGIEFVFRMDGVSIEGRVMDPQGNPIAGAEITAFNAAKNTQENISNGIAGTLHQMASVLSNAEGKFRLENLAAFNLGDGLDYLRHGRYCWEFQIQCKAKGYRMEQTALPPYPNALLKAALEFDEYKMKTDKKENFTPDYADVKLPSGEGNVITGVDLVLVPAGSISGRVLDSRGNKILSPEEEQSSSTRISLVSVEVSSGSQIQETNHKPFIIPDPVFIGMGSRFHFENVPAGRYFFDIQMRQDGVRMRARNGAVAIKEGETIQDLNLVVESREERGNVVGHVMDVLTGQPVSALSIKVLRVESPSEPKPQRGYVQTAGRPEGTFTIAQISSGKATLKISAPGYAPLQTDIEVPANEILEQTFQLEAGSGLLGMVMDAETKEPVEKFDVKITQTEGEGKGKPVEGQVLMDRNTKGRFSILGLSAGRVTVEIGNVRDRSTEVVEIEIPEGERIEQTFLMKQRGFVTGRVRVNGKEYKGNIRIVREDGIEERDQTIETDEQGEYKSKELNLGEYQMSASVIHECGFQKDTKVLVYDRAEVQVESGKETRQDFDFNGSASIQGTFKAPDRNPNWYVFVLEGAVENCDPVRVQREKNTRAVVIGLEKGDRYEIPTFPPGTYTFFACLAQREDLKILVKKEQKQVVTLTEGQALTVDFEFP